MKRKIEIVCWILFTICSGVCFFVNFMSKPPVDDTHTFTLYMIGATVVSLLYPVSMFILGLRNRYLYDKLNEIAEEKEETLKARTSRSSVSTPVSGYPVPDINILVSSLTSEQELTEEEKKERELLRKEYLASVRMNLRSQLDNIDMKMDDGTIVNLGEKYGRKKTH